VVQVRGGRLRQVYHAGFVVQLRPGWRAGRVLKHRSEAWYSEAAPSADVEVQDRRS
jgi:hypothetical protein